MIQAPDRLKSLAGEEEYAAGEALFERGGVRLIEQGATILRYMAAGTIRQEVIYGAGPAAMWWPPR